VLSGTVRLSFFEAVGSSSSPSLLSSQKNRFFRSLSSEKYQCRYRLAIVEPRASADALS